MKMDTVFKETDGQWSMRRVLACLFGLTAIGCETKAIVMGADWQVVACAFGVPGLLCLLLLLFTTWTDIASVVHAAKGD